MTTSGACPAGLDQIAFVHLQRPGPSGRRRQDTGVLEVQLGRRHRGAAGIGRRLQGRGVGDLCLVLLTRDETSIQEVLEPDQLGLGIVGLGRVAGQRRGGLVERHLERLWVHREQGLAGRDLVPFGEMHLGEAACHLRAHLDGGDRLDRANRGFRDGHRLGDRRRRHDGNGAAVAAASATTPLAGGRCSPRTGLTAPAASGGEKPGSKRQRDSGAEAARRGWTTEG